MNKLQSLTVHMESCKIREVYLAVSSWEHKYSKFFANIYHYSEKWNMLGVPLWGILARQGCKGEVIGVQNAKGLDSREQEWNKFDISAEVPKEKSLIHQMQ